MGSVGPCPRAPSGGSSAQLRHRERGAEIVSAPSRYSGRRAEGRGTGPGELSKDQSAGRRWVLHCERTGWARGLYTGLFILCTRVGSCICVVFRCSNPVICVLNVCRLCVRTCYRQEVGGGEVRASSAGRSPHGGVKLVWSKHITESNYRGEVLGPRDPQPGGWGGSSLACKSISGCLTRDRTFLTLAR